MLESALDVSIIIPAYNEEVRLPSTLKKISAFIKSTAIRCEIIVVDDGSADNTKGVVEAFQIELPTQTLKLLSHEKNTGKGAAVRTGVLAASGSFVLLYDADGATPIQELSRIWPKRSDKTVIIGSRAMPSEEVVLETRLHRKGLGRLFNLAVNLIVLPGLGDTQCGFKLLPTSAAKIIFSKTIMQRFSFDVEVLFLARQMGLEILEIAVNWTDIPGSKVAVIKDGLSMFMDLFKIRFKHHRP